MKLISITFERTGGFTGMPLQASLSITALSDEEVREILELLDASGFFRYEIPEMPEGHIPDQFFYRIEVDRTDSRHVVSVYEQQVTDDLRPLIRFLIRKAMRISQKKIL